MPFIPGTYTSEVSKLDVESRILLDTVFETLKRILLLENTEAQCCTVSVIFTNRMCATQFSTTLTPINPSYR
jgi:hypothetical protein